MLYISQNNTLRQVSALFSIQPDPRIIEPYKWIQGDGDAYIRLNSNKVTNGSVEFEMEFMVDMLSSGPYTNLSGTSKTYNGIKQFAFGLSLIPYSDTTFGCSYARLAQEPPSAVGTFNIGDTLDVKVTDTTMTINGIEYIIGTETYKGVDADVQVFWNNFDGDRNKRFKGSVSHIRLWNNNILVRDLTPAMSIAEIPEENSYNGTIISANVPGMWDSVEDKFYINANKNNGKFTLKN